MYFKLHTSKETMELLKELQNSTNLTPNVLARLAISLSIKDKTPIGYNNKNNLGLEFNRHTLTGNFDLLYKTLISQHCGRNLSDEEYFPNYLKKHLDRGMLELKKHYDYAGNFQKFIVNLANIDSEVLL